MLNKAAEPIKAELADELTAIFVVPAATPAKAMQVIDAARNSPCGIPCARLLVAPDRRFEFIGI